MNRIVYSTTTVVAIDEYTSERENQISREKLGWADNIKVGVSPVRYKVRRVKYKDANWMV